MNKTQKKYEDRLHVSEIIRARQNARAEQKMNKALSSQDAVAYCEACDELGIGPKDFLYERGNAIKMTEKKSELEDIADGAIDNFVKEIMPYIGQPFGKYAEQVKEITRKYLPSFRKGGRRDLDKHDDVKVCSIVEHVFYSYYNKK